MLHITEFAGVGKLPVLATQRVEPEKRSAPFKGRFVRLANRCGYDIAVAFSHYPHRPVEANKYSMPMHAGSVEYFEAEPGVTLHYVAL